MNKTSNIYSTIRSTKFVLKPTTRQKEILESFFGINRALYNISLYNIKNFKFGTYETKNGSIVPRIPSEIDLNNSIPKLKEEYSYLALFPADYAQATMRNLSRGFNIKEQRQIEIKKKKKILELQITLKKILE